MKSRITGLTIVIVLLFGVILAQAWFVQVHRAAALNRDQANPLVVQAGRLSPRGEILSSTGTVLAKSIRTRSSYDPWRRLYPFGSLTSDVVGYSSIIYGTGGIEYWYDGQLVTHSQPARSIGDLISPKQSNNTVQLTLSVPLQQVAARALNGQDGAVVAIDPRNGAVLAMYSNPTYDPAPLTSLSTAVQEAAWKRYNTDDPLHFPPLGNVATQETFPPGSTSKILTTAAIYRYYPALANYDFPVQTCIKLPHSPKSLCNSGFTACGGTIQVMLPESVRPRLRLPRHAARCDGPDEPGAPVRLQRDPAARHPGCGPLVLPAAQLLHEQPPGARVLGDRPAGRARDGPPGRARRGRRRERRQGDGAALPLAHHRPAGRRGPALPPLHVATPDRPERRGDDQLAHAARRDRALRHGRGRRVPAPGRGRREDGDRADG